MKTTVFIIALLLGLASCHMRFFEKSDPLPENVKDNRNDIANLFNGLFSHFNLSEPTQIHNCFNNINAGLYFNFIQELNRIFEDTKERNSVQLHLELIKLAVLDHSLKTTCACIAMTQDFTDILKALDIDERDPEKFQLFFYLYYQSHYLDLFEGFKPVIVNLNDESNEAAGDALGAVLAELVDTIKKESSTHMAFAAFGNGAAISLDIDEPDDSLKCYDKEASRLYLAFTYELAAAVAEGSIQDAPLNVYKFWDQQGKAIMDQIPKSVFECQAQSSDMQKINAKLGVNVATKEFLDGMLKYVNDNRLRYWAQAKSMRNALDNYNFHHAGSIHGHFLKAVASNVK